MRDIFLQELRECHKAIREKMAILQETGSCL